MVARNAKGAMATPTVQSGGECIWLATGVWSQAVGFVLLRMAGIYFSRHQDFSDLIW
jgi:hypothetical protein